MQVKTILNRLQKHRGFVYGTVQLEEQIAGPRADGRDRAASPQSAAVRELRPGERGVRPAGAAPLRVRPAVGPARLSSSTRCGASIARAVGSPSSGVPWADGKHQLTTTYMWFLARWAKCLSWQEVARVFRTSWAQVFRSVAMAVAWGRDHVDLTVFARSASTRSIGSAGASSSRSSTRSTRRASACCGSASTDVPRP